MIRSVCVSKRSYISYLFSYSNLYSFMIRVQKTAGASPSSEKSKHDIDRAQMDTTTLHASNETGTSTNRKWDEWFRMYLSIWHPLICIWNLCSKIIQRVRRIPFWALISHLVRPTTVLDATTSWIHSGICMTTRSHEDIQMWYVIIKSNRSSAAGKLIPPHDLYIIIPYKQ